MNPPRFLWYLTTPTSTFGTSYDCKQHVISTSFDLRVIWSEPHEVFQGAEAVTTRFAFLLVTLCALGSGSRKGIIKLLSANWQKKKCAVVDRKKTKTTKWSHMGKRKSTEQAHRRVRKAFRLIPRWRLLLFYSTLFSCTIQMPYLCCRSLHLKTLKLCFFEWKLSVMTFQRFFGVLPFSVFNYHRLAGLFGTSAVCFSCIWLVASARCASLQFPCVCSLG